MDNKKSYKAVIFDLGGVYFQNGVLASFPKLSKKIGKPKDFMFKTFKRKYIKKLEVSKITEREFWRRFTKDTGYRFTVKEIKKAIYKHFEPNDGMPRLVKDLRKKMKVGLLTNNVRAWFNYLNKKAHLEIEFDEIVVSAYVKTRKPQTKIYKIMANRLGVKPKECIFFDDFYENIVGARKVGMMAYQYKNARDVKSKLKKLGVL